MAPLKYMSHLWKIVVLSIKIRGYNSLPYYFLLKHFCRSLHCGRYKWLTALWSEWSPWRQAGHITGVPAPFSGRDEQISSATRLPQRLSPEHHFPPLTCRGCARPRTFLPTSFWSSTPGAYPGTKPQHPARRTSDSGWSTRSHAASPPGGATVSARRCCVTCRRFFRSAPQKSRICGSR